MTPNIIFMKTAEMPLTGTPHMSTVGGGILLKVNVIQIADFKEKEKLARTNGCPQISAEPRLGASASKWHPPRLSIQKERKMMIIEIMSHKPELT